MWQLVANRIFAARVQRKQHQVPQAIGVVALSTCAVETLLTPVCCTMIAEVFIISEAFPQSVLPLLVITVGTEILSGCHWVILHLELSFININWVGNVSS